MQVLFPKHIWRHTKCMPTSHWRTGASHISLRVINVAWWMSSDKSPIHCLRVCPTTAVTCFALLLLLVLLYCCYLFCPAAAATTVTCCWCYLLLLLLATVVTTVVPCHFCYSLHCCYLLQYLFARRWRERIFSVHGQLLAPLIQPLGIVCRQQIVSGTVAIILLCYWYFGCRY